VTRRIALLAVLALLVCGCGVGVQDRPEVLVLRDTPAASRAEDAPSGSAEVQVYFVRGARLEPVVRTAATDDPQAALAALVAAPRRGEVLAGLRTAIAPGTELALTSFPDRTVQVDLPRELTGLTGGNQLLAIAQLVWTLTGVPSVLAVRFSSAGSPVEAGATEA
jgi:spore germination protein GerM